MKFMRLHLPVISKWIDKESTLEKCPLCNAFYLETSVPNDILNDSKTGAYLRCQCCIVPRLRLARIDLINSHDVDLNSHLLVWIKAKKRSWNRLVHYCSISNKNW